MTTIAKGGFFMKKTNYGNWIPKTLMCCLWGGTAVLAGLWLIFTFWRRVRILSGLLLAVTLLAAAMSLYMQKCRHAFSYSGGGVMGAIHRALLEHLTWDGKGKLLDIGCGSGALSILCAKTWPQAAVTGMDYWGKEWNYAKEQCEKNAQIEGAASITFCQGDAAHLPFEDESFDAAVSNFVFHEVRTQPDKRKVVREALRVVKKGGSFAFHDLFEQQQIYGDIQELIQELKAEGITELHYRPHTENLTCIPGYVKAPWLLSGLGILYGIK